MLEDKFAALGGWMEGLARFVWDVLTVFAFAFLAIISILLIANFAVPTNHVVIAIAIVWPAILFIIGFALVARRAKGNRWLRVLAVAGVFFVQGLITILIKRPPDKSWMIGFAGLFATALLGGVVSLWFPRKLKI